MGFLMLLGFIFNAGACALNVAIYASDTTHYVNLGIAVANGLVALACIAWKERT